MDNKHKTANIIFLIFVTFEVIGCFSAQGINEIAARFTSLASFFALIVLLFGNVNVIKKLFIDKDVELWVVGVTSCIALINLFLIGSNKGAFLTAADVLLTMYIASIVYFSKRELLYLGALGASLIIWWFGNVKWYYNFNMVGMVYMTICILTLIFLELIRIKFKIGYLSEIELLLYCVSTLLCLLYHARCVLAGMIIMGLIYLLMPVISKSRLLGYILVGLSTIGSLVFTLFYILLSKTGVEITILYKDILSGRQDIWSELWTAFLKQPLTGIGSSYKIQSFFIFEVHNGLLDILVVHGVIVFAVVIGLLIRRLLDFCNKTNELYDDRDNNRILRVAYAGIFAILFTSFFENFFINSPYLMIVLILLVIPKSVENEGY